jgi:hypothetical protein
VEVAEEGGRDDGWVGEGCWDVAVCVSAVGGAVACTVGRLLRVERRG